MTTELFYLTLTALLTGVLWIPAVLGQVASRGVLTAEGYRSAPTSPLKDWARRADRAHINAVENFAIFAAVVIVAHLIGLSTGLTRGAAAVYFFARLGHAIAHISGTGILMIRTVLFSVSWLAFVVIAFEVLRYG